MGTPRAREGTWAPRETPGKSPALAPLAPPKGACEHFLISQGWGTLPRGRLVLRPCPGHALLGILARNQPAAAGTKSISWGPPPCSSIRNGDPPLRMEEQGDVRTGEDGTVGSASFPQLRPVSSTAVPGLRAPWRPRPPYLEIQGFLRGQGTPRPQSRRDRAPGPRESPRVILGPSHSGCCSLPGLLPWGLVLLAGPRFPAGEFPLRTPRIGVLHFLHGERLWSSGRLRLKRSHSLIKWFRTDFTEFKLPGLSEQPRGRWGSVCQS